MSQFEETGAKGIAEAKGKREMDYSVSSEIKETAECIEIWIRDLPRPLPEPPCIFRVYKGLRSVNEKAYTPILVSIGPYHHQNPNLSAIKQHKLRYLRSCLQRINHNNVNVDPLLIDNTSAARESKHFLDLVHRLYLPSSTEDSDSDSTQISCVTELQEAGISFKVDESDDVSILDIYFEHGRMKIPKFTVQDLTETFLRNIIAYEQHSSRDEPKYFTDYTCIMDMLINTGKDANELRLHGIIENLLGDDEEVALIFNKLGDGVVISSNFYYSNVCQKVKDHCGKPWNQAKAKLRRNYFHNPWAGISTVAAVVLLLLTLIQTVVALITLFA